MPFKYNPHTRKQDYYEIGGAVGPAGPAGPAGPPGPGLAILPVLTGAIDDSNLTFTFSAIPNMVIVNGATYRHGHGCTISGTTVTLDNPVGTGGDIYGL